MYVCMYVCICVYIYNIICCAVILWAKFGAFKGHHLGQVGVIIWAKFALSLLCLWFQAIFLSFNYHLVLFSDQLASFL